jgi:putative transposase
MPRIARVVVPGFAHHVTQRGNRRENVFFSDGDRQRYLQLLLEYSQKHGLTTLAYCLMTNHVHLVCVPAKAESLSEVFSPVNLRYAQHVNRTQKIDGRLWQGRFFSCAMDDPHLWTAIRYVERNPVRAGLAQRAERYPWSSAAAHCGLRVDPMLSPLPPGLAVTPAGWAEWLAQEEDAEGLSRLRTSTQTGRPAGDEAFVKKLESMIGRPLQARAVGRPKTGDSPKLGTPPTETGDTTLFHTTEIG